MVKYKYAKKSNVLYRFLVFHATHFRQFSNEFRHKNLVEKKIMPFLKLSLLPFAYRHFPLQRENGNVKSWDFY